MKVIVVGGGIRGLSIALELRRSAQLEVVVLGGASPGEEASSAAAGMLAPQFEGTGPGPMLDLYLLSRMAWPKWAADLEERSGVPVGYRPCGGLQVAFTDDEVHALDAKVAWQTALGLRAELLTGAALQELEPALSPRALAAAAFPDDHQVDPRKLIRALSVAATRGGVQFRAGPARALIETDGVVTGVDVEGQRPEAGRVVLAAGAWSGLGSGAEVDPAPARPVPERLIELQLRAPLFTRMLQSAHGALVPRPDGTVLVDGTMEMALQLVPGLAQASLLSAWAGPGPGTDDQRLVLGEGPQPGLWLASGHFRNEILLAPITARLLGQLVRGEKPSVDLRPFRYRRNSP